MRASIKELLVKLIMLVLLIGQIFFCRNYINLDQFSYCDASLKRLSFVCVISIIVEIYLWIKLSGEFFSPYMVFFLVMIMFTCGQSIGWSTGLDMGGKDMWDRTDHGINRILLTEALSYSMMAVGFFHFGAIIHYSKISKKRKVYTWNAEYVTSIYRGLGKLLLLIVVPSFFAKAIQDILTVASGGYAAYYLMNQSRSLFVSFISFISELFQPCLLILLIGYRDNKRKRRVIVFGMVLDAVISLYIGGRSGAVMTMLGILITYHYFIKPFKIRQFIIGCGVGYVGLAFLNGVAAIRDNVGRSAHDLLQAISMTNAVGQIIGELGWQITSVAWTMELVPSQFSFRHGMTYLASLVSWIPSFVFGGRLKHPSEIWANPGGWLEKTMQVTYGIGYSNVAESFINFGWYGVIFMFVEGIIICHFLANVSRKDVEMDIFGATFQTMIIMVLMKAIVRSSFSHTVRICVYVFLPIYFLLWFKLKKSSGIK